MSIRYQAVNWNRQKRIYDLVVGLAAPGLVILFAGVTLADPHATLESALIRGLGLAAFVLLHVILVIGPLCRLSPAFLPLLYNRRHLGVAMALLALGHAAFALVQFHGGGNRNPFVSLLSGNRHLDSVAGFPFELPGLAALLILITMAATSHDFWLSVLTPPVWKRLHMLVYAAYALLITHVALGSLQDHPGPVLAGALGAGAATVIGLHLAAGLRERRHDSVRADDQEWIDVCRVGDIAEKRARIAVVAGERVAVFRYGGRISAVSNVCRHQNGPLGEGRIVDGCITCPWHGYQYRPESGSSPPPYTDTIPTFRVRVVDGRVLVHRQPLPPGTYVEPAAVSPEPASRPSAGVRGEPEFYIGYLPMSPTGLARHTRIATGALVLLGAGAVVALALAQPPFAAATFEYGRPRVVTGRVLSHPYPALLVEDPGGSSVTSRHWLLGGAGKHGATALTGGHEGRRVRIRGPLIRRGNAAMLEVTAIEPAGETTATPMAHDELGTFALTGEIVDSKCWLGAMNPGEGKAHLACAIRCLSGGLPPLLVVRDERGRERHLVLTDPRGGPVDPARLPAVGRPVSVTGAVAREGEMLFLRADPASFRVLP